MQELHTHRRDTIAKLDQRLHSAQTAPVSPAPKEEWLWTAIGTLATKESALNALIDQLYHLTPEEIAMVEGG